MELLLEHDADVNFKDANGQTALDLASDRKIMVELKVMDSLGKAVTLKVQKSPIISGSFARKDPQFGQFCKSGDTDSIAFHHVPNHSFPYHILGVCTHNTHTYTNAHPYAHVPNAQMHL